MNTAPASESAAESLQCFLLYGQVSQVSQVSQVLMYGSF